MYSPDTPILAYLQSRSTAQTRRWLMGMGAVTACCFVVVAAFGNVAGVPVGAISQENVLESLELAPTTLTNEDSGLFIREEKIRPGDSANSLLGRLGIEDTQLIDASRSNVLAQPLFRQLSPGKTVTAYLERDGQLHSLIFPLNEKQDQALELLNTSSGLKLTQKEMPLEKRIVVKSADISYSLFGATDAAGIPDAVAAQMVDIFGGDIDFHHDLKKGDHFSVSYELITHLGKPLRSGRILAAEFINEDKSYKAVWFQTAGGQGSYYTPEGKSLRKSFLRSPLEFSRVTSGFSMSRFHPVLQQWRAHKGVDFGAPTGTRVKATGDAIVDFIGRQNGYGKVVILKHQGPYTTVYGHLSGFASGLRKGSRVLQGDLIGYVGQSGLASGPHLHYEFRVDGVFKDPLLVKLPGAASLSNDQLTVFHNETTALLARIDSLRHVNLASAD